MCGDCLPLGAAYHWWDRVWRRRNGRWPSFPCSSGHCFWVLGYCSGDKQTALLPRRSGNTGPRTPRTPSCRDLMSAIENRRYFSSEGRKTFNMCIRKSPAFNDSRNSIPHRVEFNAGQRYWMFCNYNVFPVLGNLSLLLPTPHPHT